MKKKAIEKIPYLTLKRLSRKKHAKYVGVTAVKIVDHKKHLILEVYKNEKEAKKIPKVRIAINEHDFGNYFPESGTWTRGKIVTEYGRLIWSEPGSGREETVLAGDEDLGRIRKYSKREGYDYKDWIRYLGEYQDRIVDKERRERQNRIYEKRQRALQDRIAHTPDLREETILDYADTRIFGKRHYLYYKKYGSFVRVACSKCGGVAEARWRGGMSCESQFERHIEEPKAGEEGICQLCGAHGEYKCQGKAKKDHIIKNYVFLGQPYKDQGLVMRYIQVEKTWKLCTIQDGKTEKMYGAKEELGGIEIARAYFELGKKVQIDYHKHNPYQGKDFWDDCNLYGISSISIRDAGIMEETYDALKGTMFRYSAMREYEKARGTINPIDYLECYQEMPQIEMLVKFGMTRIVSDLERGWGRSGVNPQANRLDTFLGIRKDKVKRLIASGGDTKILRVMQIEKWMGQRWTDNQISQIAETGLGKERIEQALQYMTIQQLLNRIQKYAGCEYGTGCGRAYDRMREVAGIYTDYLQMRQELGYDLRNTIYQKPRDLKRAHDEMALKLNKTKMEKHIREKESQFPEIRKRYRKLRKEYGYENEGYFIRPARSAGEIILEGRTLHHCVGGDNYLRNHDKGKNYILMLRSKEEPETPYITVEIDAERKTIRQWYGEGDKKTDQKRMESWLGKYQEYLKENGQIRIRSAVA